MELLSITISLSSPCIIDANKQSTYSNQTKYSPQEKLTEKMSPSTLARTLYGQLFPFYDHQGSRASNSQPKCAIITVIFSHRLEMRHNSSRNKLQVMIYYTKGGRFDRNICPYALAWHQINSNNNKSNHKSPFFVIPGMYVIRHIMYKLNIVKLLSDQHNIIFSFHNIARFPF